jgi:hypothetical protein
MDEQGKNGTIRIVNEMAVPPVVADSRRTDPVYAMVQENKEKGNLIGPQDDPDGYARRVARRFSRMLDGMDDYRDPFAGVGE